MRDVIGQLDPLSAWRVDQWLKKLRRWMNNGVCPTCLESMLSGQSEDEQRAILGSMIESGDALLAWRARQRINASVASNMIEWHTV